MILCDSCNVAMLLSISKIHQAICHGVAPISQTQSNSMLSLVITHDSSRMSQNSLRALTAPEPHVYMHTWSKCMYTHSLHIFKVITHSLHVRRDIKPEPKKAKREPDRPNPIDFYIDNDIRNSSDIHFKCVSYFCAARL